MESINVTMGKQLIALLDKQLNYGKDCDTKILGALMTNDIDTANTVLKCQHTSNLKVEWIGKNFQSIVGETVEDFRKKYLDEKPDKNLLKQGLEMLNKGILDLTGKL